MNTPKKQQKKQRTETCKFCGDKIGASSITRHQVKCEKQTPEQRNDAKHQRDYQMQLYYKNHKQQLDEPVVPVAPDKRSYQSHFVGTNGDPISKPMSISMLVDEDKLALALGRVVIQKLPELLPQLIPGLAIEAFATKSHRAKKV
jgi:hypothetical protein